MKERDVKKIAKQELRENIEVIKSLRDYDEGKKNISTDTIKGRWSSL